MKFGVGFLLASLSLAINAQEPPYPQKTNIEITVLFPAGSSADVTARLLAEGMAKQLGTNVIVVDRPGAGGAIGYKYVAAQKPDGTALVWNSNSISTTFHSGQLPFDYRAFEPVARVLAESPLLVVKSDAPWKTLAEFVADAKSRPGKLSIANSGSGSHTHISAAALERAAGIEAVNVPFGAAQVIPSLLGGHVDAMVQLPGAMAGALKSGQLRALCAIAQSRDPAFPEVPTAREQGVDAALDAWRGLAAPKGTPKAAIEALEAAVRRAVESADFARGAEKLAVRPAYQGAAAFGQLIAREDAELARLMQVIGLKK